MRAYSLDLRRRIVAAVAAGMSKHEAARVYQVSVMTVRRYLKLHAADRLRPKPIPGRRREIGSADEAALRALVAADPDATLAQRCAAWAREHEVAVSRATMSRALARAGLRRKKSR